MVKFNPYMSDYDMTVLRWLNGDLPLIKRISTTYYTMTLDDLMCWGLLSKEMEVTDQGKEYIRQYTHRYMLADI